MINLCDMREKDIDITNIKLPDRSTEILIRHDNGDVTQIIFSKEQWANIIDWQLR
jgi:hypothetical protein